MPHLTLRDGRTIFCSVEGPDDGLPMLLLHGWACDGTDWAWLAADPAYRTVAVDHRGHGRSSPADVYTPRLMAVDAAAVIDALGLDRPVVVGHSMGTVVASALAVERPDLVRALVLVDPVYGQDDAMLAPVLEGIRADPHGVAVQAFGAFYGPSTPPWLPVWHRRRILATDPAVVRDVLVGLYSGDEGLGRAAVGAGYLARRQAPTLAVYSGAMAPVAEWDRALPHGPHDEIEVWPEHGHFLHQEAPDRFAGTVRAWLGRLAA